MSLIEVQGNVTVDGVATPVSAALRRIGKRLGSDEIIIQKLAPTILRGETAGLAARAITKGSRVTVKLNGETIVDADLSQIKDEAVLKKHPGLKRDKGHIGFCGHGREVEFKNVRIKEL